MAKRNIFNISDEHLQKEAFVGKLLKSVGTTAIDMLKDWAIDKGMSAVVGGLAGRGQKPKTLQINPKVRADVIQYISSLLRADPNHPMVKKNIPNQAARAKLEAVLKSLQSELGAVSYGSNYRK